MTMSDGTVVVVAGLAVVVAILAPMINHVVWCIDKASETGSAIALLIVGIVVPPIGWLHGVALFFGTTWI